MEQKDYILREIEKISVLLRYLLGKVIPSNESEKVFTTEELNQELEATIGMNLQNLALIPPEDLLSGLSGMKGFTLENVELLANILFQVANRDNGRNPGLLNQSLRLYRYIDKIGHTYSFDRANKIQTILKILDTQEE